MDGITHFYNEDVSGCCGKLCLDDGREIPVNPRLFSSVEQAVVVLSDWAKQQNLIGTNDTIAAFF